jgi:hypothetical protein
MRRLIKCEYTDLRTGETWVRVFEFDTATGERYDDAKKEIENAPLPDPKRPYWGGRDQ